MVIADSVHFTYERNFFPSLTDKEFEVMVLFCQLMSVNKVAKFLGKSESVVLKHLNNCKKKLNVKGDYDLGFFFSFNVLQFEKQFPQLERNDIILMATYFFDPSISVVARNLSLERRDVKERLSYIQTKLEVKDLRSLRMRFFINIALVL